MDQRTQKKTKEHLREMRQCLCVRGNDDFKEDLATLKIRICMFSVHLLKLLFSKLPSKFTNLPLELAALSLLLMIKFLAVGIRICYSSIKLRKIPVVFGSTKFALLRALKVWKFFFSKKIL